MKGISKNLEFAQMPHKGTPIRYGQKQPVRSRQQGAGKVLQRRIFKLYVSKKLFPQHSSWDEIQVFRDTRKEA